MDINERFEQANDEFLKFDQIPLADQLHPRPDLCAFLFLHNKFGGKGDMVCHAEHDEIWLDVEEGRCDELTDADIVFLSRCGVRYGEYGLCMFA